jgi:hypothetical protein
MDNTARILGLQINQGEKKKEKRKKGEKNTNKQTKQMIVERENMFKTKQNRTFENNKITNLKELQILNI